MLLGINRSRPLSKSISDVIAKSIKGFPGKLFLSTESTSKNLALVKSTKVNWVRPSNLEEVSALGKQYNEILFKGRDGRAVGLADLRRMLQKCDSPTHVKYAVKIVEYYQGRGHDFAEDINSLFVKACIKGDDPKAAANAITKVLVLLLLSLFLLTRTLLCAFISSKIVSVHGQLPLL